MEETNGDCWLLAAIANLTLNAQLFYQIVPDDQSFVDKYAGIFHFRFWQYGRWVDVVIDDRLPTCDGKLVYLHSSTSNEFWSALLEKAYAKLYSSYEALKGGTASEAMEDFTGGVLEKYVLSQAPPDLYKIMLKAYERSSLMVCAIEPDPNIPEAKTPEGLVKGHAYSITKVKQVDIQTPTPAGKIPLIRLRNPWGNAIEWNGPWSDKSQEWGSISENEKKEIGLTFDADGEFWMCYKDFQSQFDCLEMCNLSPDSLTEEEMLDGNKRKWEMSMFEGEWVIGVTAGGCRNYLETFWQNPHYRIKLEDDDEDEDDEGEDEADEDNKNKCTVIVALMQKNRRSQRRRGVDILAIGFTLYYLQDPDNLPKPLDLDFFKYHASVARSPSFINLREVSSRFKLPPGVYCIIPSTFDPNEEGEFLIRVFSEHKNNMAEHDEEVAVVKVDESVVCQAEPEEEKNVDEVKELFREIAGDDMEVDWMELKVILDSSMKKELCSSTSSQDSSVVTSPPSMSHNTFPMQATENMNTGFSKDVCRSLIAVMDTDRSGKLGYEEFKVLWTDIRCWKAVFKFYDNDGNGYINVFELQKALNSAGYKLSKRILNILARRYATQEGSITFDDYMMCVVRLHAMIDIFKQKDPDGTNTATFTFEEWIEKALYS